MLSFKNIRGLRSNFVDCEFFLESYSPNILALRGINLDEQVGSSSLSVIGYLPLIQEDSISHMRGLAVYMKEELLFERELSMENSVDSFLCFRLALFHSMFYFFFLYRPINHLQRFLPLDTLTSIIRTGLFCWN